jgi:hypothetical protein
MNNLILFRPGTSFLLKKYCVMDGPSSRDTEFFLRKYNLSPIVITVSSHHDGLYMNAGSDDLIDFNLRDPHE